MSKKTEQLRNLLLHRLADGGTYSGEQLGQLLGISRAAVANYIQFFTDLGLDIFRVRGKGYRLANKLQLLDQSLIQSQLKEEFADALEVLNVVDSSNDYLKSRLGSLRKGHVCLAEAQTAGRGRHGRTWVSPLGASLYLSIYWSFREGYQALAGLSLAIGVAVARALTDCGVVGCQLKWPNDVYLTGRKLAGILIEVEGQIGAACDTIIGIGLNIRLPDAVKGIDQPWTDLYQSGGVEICRNQLAGELINQLHQVLLEFEQSGLGSFIKQWQQLDIYADAPVQLIMGDKTIEGIGRGINESGALMLQLDGEIKAFHGGEISVRPKA